MKDVDDMTAEEMIRNYEENMRIMFNRCMALTKGATCYACSLRRECKMAREGGASI